MTQYILKSALVAWAKKTYLCENASMIRKVCYKQLLEHLDTLEVKEVNSTDDFIEKVESFLNKKDDRDSYTIGYIKRHLKEIIKEVGL